MPDIIKYTSDSTFQVDVLNPKGPILVDFYAEWCSPCKAIAQSLNNLSSLFVDCISVYKLNLEENPIVASKYNVDSIPTLVIIKCGVEINRLKGAAPEEVIKQWIEQTLIAYY